MMRKSNSLVVIVTLGLLSGTTLSYAQTETRLTAEEAIAIALEAQTGTIGEAELDQFDGREVYDIEVINDAGQEIEFKVDVLTGDILNTWTDDDPTDDPAAGAAEEASD